MTKGQTGGGASSKSKQAKQNELRSTSAPVTSTDRHTSTKTRLVLFTRESETPMHLLRLWTDAPVAKKTQVNSTTNKRGTSRKKGATNRSRPEQKGPNRADKGGQNRETRRPKGKEVD